MTESEMREAQVPTPNNEGELIDYIRSLIKQQHDYGTCVYAVSMAATAAFQYVASELGITGFQASCADMDIIRRTRSLKGPFMLIDGTKMLYPQYDIIQSVRDAMTKWEKWASDECRKMLAQEDTRYVCFEVLSHWQDMAAKHPNTASTETAR